QQDCFLYQVHTVLPVNQTHPNPLDEALHSLASVSSLKKYLLPCILQGVQRVTPRLKGKETYPMHKAFPCLNVYLFEIFCFLTNIFATYFQFPGGYNSQKLPPRCPN